jgi:predicted DNA-binding transcriptional regulator YafY
MKLSSIIENILLESQNSDIIIKAIEDKRLINIYYDDDKTDLSGWRRVEPYVVGINKKGNEVLRAWQQHGVSASYPPGKDGSNGSKRDPLTFIPGWRMFRLDKITNINTTGNDRFLTPRPKYNPNDSHIETIYKAADFSDKKPLFAPQKQTQQPIEPVSDKKPSIFDKFKDRFKNLIGNKK